MRIGVKICGISTEAAVDACIEADVDWIGLVFFARSPRYVTPARAAELSARLPHAIAPVGLFVAPADDEIERALDNVELVALQIYDRPHRIGGLRRRFDLPVWHACPVSTRAELPAGTDADRLLIEAGAARSDRPGGNGAELDWRILQGWRSPAPWILAGGLTDANVIQAIHATGAQTVDVSSGVENGPGSKDPAAILSFTRAARRAPGAATQ